MTYLLLLDRIFCRCKYIYIYMYICVYIIYVYMYMYMYVYVYMIYDVMYREITWVPHHDLSAVEAALQSGGKKEARRTFVMMEGICRGA